MIKQTVLPFKLERTNDLITSHAGLALLGEFAVALGLCRGCWTSSCRSPAVVPAIECGSMSCPWY